MPGQPLIFLIGYRGTGKTTVARLLAEKLQWQEIDADQFLETRYGRSIGHIFAFEGEAGFRQKEAALLEELCRLEHHVVATGGGVILRPENRQRLRDSGWIVWLSADARTIWERLQRDSATVQRRPILTQGGLAEIEELLQVRETFYASCADLTVDTAQRTPEEIVAIILEHLPRLQR